MFSSKETKEQLQMVDAAINNLELKESLSSDDIHALKNLITLREKIQQSNNIVSWKTFLPLVFPYLREHGGELWETIKHFVEEFFKE